MANVRDMGSPAKLGTKSITVNGTYNASSDNLDGFSQVSVNVPETNYPIEGIAYSTRRYGGDHISLSGVYATAPEDPYCTMFSWPIIPGHRYRLLNSKNAVPNRTRMAFVNGDILATQSYGLLSNVVRDMAVGTYTLQCSPYEYTAPANTTHAIMYAFYNSGGVYENANVYLIDVTDCNLA